MRRRVLGSLVAALALAAAPAVALGATATHVSVSPGFIGPHTAVVLRFQAPNTTGTIGPVLHTDAVVLRGPSRSGCIGVSDVVVRGADAGQRMTMTLRPGQLGGRWCTGRYAGELVERTQPACGPGPVRACPEYIQVGQTLARFSFRVVAR